MKLRTTETSITTKIISNEEGDKTFEIRKYIPSIDGRTAVLIMLYPGIGYRDILKCDDTTQNILNHCDELGIDDLRIMNIFSKVCKAKPSTRNIQVDSENLTYLENVMKEEGAANYIWGVCWGSSMQTCLAVNETKKQLLLSIKSLLPTVKLKQLTVDGLQTQSDGAVHPLYLGIRHGNKTWRLEDYEVVSATVTNSSFNHKEKSIESSKANKINSLKEKVVKNTPTTKRDTAFATNIAY